MFRYDFCGCVNKAMIEVRCFLKPIVLVGGGENHYRLIQAMSEHNHTQRPIILIANQNKIFPRRLLPLTFGDIVRKDNVHFDLWSACQRTGVYFLEDECININSDDRVVYLKKYGKLEYHYLSIETQTKAFVMEDEIKSPASIMANNHPEDLLKQLQLFFGEVHKHCPREIRVVLTGLSQESLDMGYFINQELEKSCESIDIVFIEQTFEKAKVEKILSKRVKKQLKECNIRVLLTDAVDRLVDHQVTLNEGLRLEFDIFIPCDGWLSQDFLGKLLQTDGQKIWVDRDLSLCRDKALFVTGNNVQFQDESVKVSEIQLDELCKVLLHNLFKTEEGTPRLTCRNQKRIWLERPFLRVGGALGFMGAGKRQDVKKKWQSLATAEVKKLRELPLLESSQECLQKSLDYEAQHMSRPWKGLIESKKEGRSTNYRLTSFNGFNSWGSYTQSANKICEIAIMKTMSKGVKPSQLRFNLTLPSGQKHLTSHIFESTFKAIEEIAVSHNIEIDGGDTFDGNYWHLTVTIGGEVFRIIDNKFKPHDYLLITRPLGFGFLWASRLHSKFDSQWIQNTMASSILTSFDQWTAFQEEFNPSASVLIEEWGFLYHCLQNLPYHQQLMVNFREVPRWQGIDKTLDTTFTHPGLDTNWERIKNDVAFDRSEVSLNNSILWDSLSQGGMVIGVEAQKYKEALCRLQEMGYKEAALVGCIRPKHGDNKVVLSDWMP